MDEPGYEYEDKPKRYRPNGGWDLPPNLTKVLLAILALLAAGFTIKIIFAPEHTWNEFIFGQREDSRPTATVESVQTPAQDLATSTVSAPSPTVSTPTSTIVLITPSSPPTSTKAITPQPVASIVDTITIPGNSSEGVRFTADQQGYYTFQYVEGAYSTYPVNQIPANTNTWLTSVLAFKGEYPEFDGQIIRHDRAYFSVADTRRYWPSEADASRAAAGSRVRIHLGAGEILTLIAVDEQSYYFDNPGGVVLEVLFTPS